MGKIILDMHGLGPHVEVLIFGTSRWAAPSILALQEQGKDWKQDQGWNRVLGKARASPTKTTTKEAVRDLRSGPREKDDESVRQCVALGIGPVNVRQE